MNIVDSVQEYVSRCIDIGIPITVEFCGCDFIVTHTQSDKKVKKYGHERLEEVLICIKYIYSENLKERISFYTHAHELYLQYTKDLEEFKKENPETLNKTE
jgi:hypothetical protein